MRQAAAAWENHYADKLSGVGFSRGVSCGVVFYQKDRDMSLVGHCDGKSCSGPEEKEDKEVVIVGRVVKWKDEGIKYEAGPKHRRIILGYFGFDSRTKPGMVMETRRIE
eukprot:2677368-Karenia_brevis.AAC.1